MKLSEIPWEELAIGDRCISAIKNPGKITKIYYDTRLQPFDEDSHLVELEWENGNKSLICHWDCTNIEYIG